MIIANPTAASAAATTRTKKTHILFLIGILAMSGVPPFAAFFSKDLILEEEFITGHNLLFYFAWLTSILTAFYLTRAYCITFLGNTRVEMKWLKTLHEAPSVMLRPEAILAFLSIAGGFLGFALNHPPLLALFLEESDVTLPQHAISSGFHFSPVAWLSIISVLFGIGLAALLYTRFFDRLTPAPAVLTRSFYLDDFYDACLVRPLKNLSRLIAYVLEPRFLEGSIRMAANTTEKGATLLQKFQSGQIRSYVAWMTLGMVALMIYLINNIR
jgi:NADH-quinone oxidoreductase subunit L